MILLLRNATTYLFDLQIISKQIFIPKTVLIDIKFFYVEMQKKNTSNIFLYIIYERQVLKRHLAEATITTNKRFVDTHHQLPL